MSATPSGSPVVVLTQHNNTFASWVAILVIVSRLARQLNSAMALTLLPTVQRILDKYSFEGGSTTTNSKA